MGEIKAAIQKEKKGVPTPKDKVFLTQLEGILTVKFREKLGPKHKKNKKKNNP